MPTLINKAKQDYFGNDVREQYNKPKIMWAMLRKVYPGKTSRHGIPKNSLLTSSTVFFSSIGHMVTGNIDSKLTFSGKIHLASTILNSKKLQNNLFVDF